ncbi:MULTISPECIES: ATP-binding cassette domain-containing protein [unclassified Thauera]|uniref:phosphonate ABC transporter ATP-binding protein n=1 Tax=unclassified Thauera TaxID=2609274 RepID=UPI0002CE7AB6|nr:MULTISPECIES: ATP-binding cassette domain-containing protein [unclassified Thauera]ENO81896.1 Phosphonate ABC transporter ATP-binding protein [Thauera sp. 27]ENO94256.1 Phosphonate ABC transporter ATP-binding protein [Thauera sp. 28]WBL64416.1 ATP-binding cassette domain-containing protein [Thauera sp. WB-2]
MNTDSIDAQAVPEHPVRLQGAAVAYGGQRVLDDISLDIAPGERVAVIGPSGAGKTTLFRLIAGLVKPAAGCALTLGEDTRRLRGRRLARLRRELGFLYQQDNLIPQLRVVHNVLMGRLGHWSLARALLSLLWPQQIERARAALARVELADKLWALPDELSGGQQQRVAVARLIVQQPRLVLADEPVSALDLRLGREIIGLLCQLAQRDGVTLVVNLHTLDLLQGHFDRVIALRGGRLFWQGEPAQITQHLLRELYGAEYRALHLDEIEVQE